MNTMYNNYKFVRKNSPLSVWHNNTFVGYFISTRLSPFFTMYFIRNNYKPNTITLLMILSGWIGAIFFAIDNIFFKLVGYVFIHLWFIFDCSDGEVARLTQTFSKMGKELDYVAHIVNHPAFGISFLISAFQFSDHASILPDIWMIILFFLLIVFNLIGRGLMSLNLIYDIRNNTTTEHNAELTVKKLLKYIIRFFCQFPNIAILYPMLYFLDLYLDTHISIYYIILSTFFTFGAVVIMTANILKVFSR